jgi:hypothetical protein
MVPITLTGGPRRGLQEDRREGLARDVVEGPARAGAHDAERPAEEAHRVQVVDQHLRDHQARLARHEWLALEGGTLAARIGQEAGRNGREPGEQDLAEKPVGDPRLEVAVPRAEPPVLVDHETDPGADPLDQRLRLGERGREGLLAEDVDAAGCRRVDPRGMGLAPIVQGVGDRPYPGAYMLEETLLKKLGRDDYGKLLAGKLSYKDPRVVQVFTYVKSLVDAGAYPKSFATLKLGESHYYFHTKPGGLMFPMGSWYTARAFVPPDKGGQPENFPLGIMSVPAMDGAACNQCKTLAVGASFSINAATKHPKLAAGMLNEMATPEMGASWLSTILLQTAIKTDMSKVTGKYAAYFQELGDRNKTSEYFIGIPIDHLQGQCRESFVQVMNTAFPGGLLTVDKAVDMMNQGCFTG